MNSRIRPDRCLICEARTSNPVCQLPAPAAERFSRYSRVVNCDSESALFRQGDPARQVFIIRSGLVKLSFEHPDGAEQLLRIAGPGETLGLATRTDAGMPVSAVARGSASLCRSAIEDIEKLVESDPEFALAWAHLLTDEIQRAREAVLHLGPHPAAVRLARLLAVSRRRLPDKTHRSLPVLIAVTHAELAAQLSIAQETVTRLLSQLEDSHVILLGRGRISILDPDRLEALAGLVDVTFGTIPPD